MGDPCTFKAFETFDATGLLWHKRNRDRHFQAALPSNPHWGQVCRRGRQDSGRKYHVKSVILIIFFQAGVDQLLDKIYELYADFALKNPFYSLEMPIRYGTYTMDDFEFSNIICRSPRADLFDEQLQVAIDQIERTGFI